MKIFLRHIIGIPLLVFTLFCSINLYNKSTDNFIRNQVLKLYDNRGSCTGVQIIAPSGKFYVLTAGHCSVLVHNNKVMAEDEQGRKLELSFIEEDATSDLMLLSSPIESGVKIAFGAGKHDSVHSITHGKGMPSYRTDGELLATDITSFTLFAITSRADFLKCQGPKYKIGFEGFQTVCKIESFQTVSNTSIIPGSSGGPLLNVWGSLVGIASTRGEFFCTFASLADIKSFLRDR